MLQFTLMIVAIAIFFLNSYQSFSKETQDEFWLFLENSLFIMDLWSKDQIIIPILEIIRLSIICYSFFLVNFIDFLIYINWDDIGWLVYNKEYFLNYYKEYSDYDFIPLRHYSFFSTAFFMLYLHLPEHFIEIVSIIIMSIILCLMFFL